MVDSPEPYEIRDPIHGFIRLNELEWDVINQPVFQRLRRIRQLAWTDMVYVRHHAPEEVFSDDAVLAKGVKDLKPKYGDQEIRKAIRDVRDFLKPALAA